MVVQPQMLLNMTQKKYGKELRMYQKRHGMVQNMFLKKYGEVLKIRYIMQQQNKNYNVPFFKIRKSSI